MSQNPQAKPSTPNPQVFPNVQVFVAQVYCDIFPEQQFWAVIVVATVWISEGVRARRGETN